MTRDEVRYLEDAGRYGLTMTDAAALKREARTLHRWAEQECGDGNEYMSWAIVRDDVTGKPYKEFHPHHAKSYRLPTPDREKGAHRRVAAIMTGYPNLIHQFGGDPRGAVLKIFSMDRLTKDYPELTIPEAAERSSSYLPIG